MGFVKTTEEVSEIQEVLAHPRFVNAEMLQMEFLTDPETVSHVLPPPLEPVEDPLVVAMVGRWQSNCVADFAGGAIYVASRFRDVEGLYVLAMFMDTDAAIIFGRDLFGEPKKQARSDLRRRGTRFRGWVERHGTTLIDIEADLTTDLGPEQVQGVNFNVKATPSSDGVGLEGDAVLTQAEFDNDLWVNREGEGSLSLKGTVHDPLDEIEVIELVRATYIEGDLIASCRSVASIPADDFVPYAYGRLDDWRALDTETTSSRTISAA